ncbi:MAG: tRNA preQ1(34) S-adenosylmethionine ribosyltransferase-isomerase QueA [Desulfobacteraceae bacterium]|nr:tRNA preQ1(34) S-adenosylmethionine ribosyltransferase-isomerase QueA [Desulfobacteraceae bacterium]
MSDPPYDLAAYDYQLPEELIAQEPQSRRDQSRLLVVNGGGRGLEDWRFAELPRLVAPGEVMVINDTRVFPARLLGRKESGGQVELLLLNYPEPGGVDGGGEDWRRAEARGLVRSSKRPKPGGRLLFGPGLEAQVIEELADGEMRLDLHWQGELDARLAARGQVPLPPYIRRSEGEGAADRQRYQTIYARENGAVAAPTAGLHFSDALLAALAAQGVILAPVTLHVGYGTFAPVRTQDIREHKIHAEWVTVPAATVDAIHQAVAAGRRVWAVGTTSARALEFAAASGRLEPVSGWCRLYIYPGYRFRVVDRLITNFHLPKSSLLFMVSAFAGFELVRRAYQEALARRYRFYSYGDAMLLSRK